MDAFVRADWRTVRETVQELRGQGEFLAGLLAEHQSLLRRQDTCGEHVATAWKELQETEDCFSAGAPFAPMSVSISHASNRACILTD